MLNEQGILVKVLRIPRGKTDVEVNIEIAPSLWESIERTQKALGLVELKTFLVNEYGQPFTDNGFGNKFREWRRKARVQENRSAHGLRKSAATIAAERGATTTQLKAWFGWESNRMPDLYTKKADRRKQAVGAAAKLG